MDRRSLGNTGLQVSTLALGGNVFGWTADEGASFKVLDAFTEAGGNLIDTADVYSRWAEGNSGGESETVIGNWMKSRKNRDQVIIATKVGSDMGDGNKGLSRKYIFQAVENSLRRLQTDYIDLYQAHYDFPEYPLQETLGAFDELYRQGKIRAAGASNYSAERLTEALQISESAGLISYQTLQPLYNLYDRAAFEKDLQPVCLEKGLGVINYYSLASGFLTGKYRNESDLNQSKRGQGNKKYLTPRGMRILEALDKISADYNASPAEVSIAWLLSRHAISACIASARTADQLDVLVKGTRLRLDADVLEYLTTESEESGTVS
ncbi:MAG TPA: aldo/keto reductase [Sphingobacteriaceae bacterium]